MSIHTRPRRAVTNPPPVRNHNPRNQSLAILLDGITAGDYLTWSHDPDPPALGGELRAIAVDAHPLGQRISVDLVWDRQPPDPRRAAAAAGFALTPEVDAVRASDLPRRPRNRRGDRRSR